jgi:hypothetical protein
VIVAHLMKAAIGQDIGVEDGELFLSFNDVSARLRTQMNYPMEDEPFAGTLGLPTSGRRMVAVFDFLIVALLLPTGKERDSKSFVNILGNRECSFVEDGAKNLNIGGA